MNCENFFSLLPIGLIISLLLYGFIRELIISRKNKLELERRIETYAMNKELAKTSGDEERIRICTEMLIEARIDYLLEYKHNYQIKGRIPQ